MASQNNSGFRYTPPGGVLTTHPAKLRLREGAAARVKTRYRQISLDQRTIDTVTIEGGADEMQGIIRVNHDPVGLLVMLDHGASGVVLNYYSDLSLGVFYPFVLMNFADVVEIRPDRDRFAMREWESVVRLRRIDGGSIDGLL